MKASHFKDLLLALFRITHVSVSLSVILPAFFPIKRLLNITLALTDLYQWHVVLVLVLVRQQTLAKYILRNHVM